MGRGLNIILLWAMLWSMVFALHFFQKYTEPLSLQESINTTFDTISGELGGIMDDVSYIHNEINPYSVDISG